MGKEPRDPQGTVRDVSGFHTDIDMVPFDAQLGANFDDLRGLFMFGLWIISY